MTATQRSARGRRTRTSRRAVGHPSRTTRRTAVGTKRTTRGRARSKSVARKTRRMSVGRNGTFNVKVEGVRMPVESAWHFGG